MWMYIYFYFYFRIYKYSVIYAGTHLVLLLDCGVAVPNHITPPAGGQSPDQTLSPQPGCHTWWAALERKETGVGRSGGRGGGGGGS